MKQVLQDARSGEIAVAEVPAPKLLPGCVLVRVAASVVSAGTERAAAEFARRNLLEKARARPDLVAEGVQKIRRDGIFSSLQAVRTRLDQPQSPGYSASGIVIAVGEGVTDLQPGDRVACAGAGFAVHAEIACVPRLLTARIPLRDPSVGGEIPLEEAAFATLGAVALHGLRTAEIKLGEVVAVIGFGLLGQLTVQLLRSAGCRVFGMDINEARAGLARTMGAERVTTSATAFRELCLEQSRGAGVDAVLITAETPSSDPVNLAGAIARDRAIVVAVGTVGIEIERKSYYEKELDFRVSRSYGPGRYDAAYEQKGRDYPIGYVRWTENRNMEAFLSLLADKKVDVRALITHRFPIERIASAYDLIMGRTGEPSLGVVIEYSGRGESSSTLRVAQAAPQATATQPIGLGVLGTGVFASGTLMPAITATSAPRLVAACAATGAHAQHFARKFGFAYCTTDESQILHDPQINTIVIATRHHLHGQQVLAAIAAQKHVFCEKPLCLSEFELRAIVQAYLEASLIPRPALMVGFNRRFAPMIVRMKSFLANVTEPLALHYRINAGYLPPDHWVHDPQQGGGRILGEVCHFLDLLMFLAGSPITEVSARALRDSGRYRMDNIMVSLRFANGSEGTVHYLANGDRSFSKERVEVFGGGTACVLEDFRRLALVRNGRKHMVHSRWRQDKGHRGEWSAFSDFAQGKSEMPIPFEDLVRSTLATLRVHESAVTGRPLAVDAVEFIATAQRRQSAAPR